MFEHCLNCRFWHELVELNARMQVHAERQGEPWKPVGWCRRRPPVVLNLDDDAVTHWPQTDLTEWCGEWELRRNG